MAKHLTEEKKNANYVLWVRKLKQYECYSEEMCSELGDLIRNASFAMQSNSGAAYEGSLLDVTLNRLCVVAMHIANTFEPTNEKKGHPELTVNKTSLMRVLLLQHVAKALMFLPETSDWKIKNGSLYKFNDDLAATLKLGERSLFLCMNYGIKLTEEEYEAMRIIDKEPDKSTQFTNPLSMLVKNANDFTLVECYRTNLNKK